MFATLELSRFYPQARSRVKTNLARHCTAWMEGSGSAGCLSIIGEGPGQGDIRWTAPRENGILALRHGQLSGAGTLTNFRLTPL